MLKGELVLEQLEQGLWGGLLWTTKVKIIFVHLKLCSKRRGKVLVGHTQGVLRPSVELVGGTRSALMVTGPVAGSQECFNLEGDEPSEPATALKISTTAGSGFQECSSRSNSGW